MGDKMKYCQVKVVRIGDWTDRRVVVLGFRNVDEETQREMEKKTLLEDAQYPWGSRSSEGISRCRYPGQRCRPG